jgi:hypothetical protein
LSKNQLFVHFDVGLVNGRKSNDYIIAEKRNHDDLLMARRQGQSVVTRMLPCITNPFHKNQVKCGLKLKPHLMNQQ